MSIRAPLIKLIVFAVVTIVLTAMLAQTLGSWATGGTEYRARFTDVTSLLEGDDVRIAGVRVGKITRIRVVDDSIAEVRFTVTDDVPLGTGVRAKIRYRNLVGQRYLALFEGPSTGRTLHRNGVIPLEQTAPALDLTTLFNGFRPLFTALSPDDVNKLAYEIIQVLQGEGGTMASLLRRTASLTSTLADRDAVIGRVITNLNAVLSTVDERDGQLDQTIAQLQQLVSGLAADRGAIGQSLANLGELTLATGSLLGDARPPLASDVDGLRQVAGNLNANSAAIDRALAAMPGRYEALTRVASHGSWFNFFLCDLSGNVTLGGTTVAMPTFSSTAPRCNAA
ncbi:MCE family protein [Virgisporangium aurantiacum]|uniref:ABC transporter substrate-binding protein n=1 Tax=Virgisporangium aurantiacum TaxID=175570 RepID=A0A8J3YXS1_9ACTN|nr:MCE family protein [Virgisporangium aurantiacum]GIJ52637.1 ABC transporter substrate-binding protein [Virgisporangium aurantiacum]